MCVRVDAVGLLRVSLALALCVPMSGCKKQGESTSPSAEDRAAEAQAPDDSADPVAELAALEGRMRAFGLPVAADKGKGDSVEGEDDGMGGNAAAGAASDHSPAPAEEAPAPSAQIDASEPGRDEEQVQKNYCGDLCSLSESICMLEVRICSLAESHTNDSTYADACERAVEDCEVAGQACDGCG